jgi:GT2 family glycosyltransferase
MIDIVSATRHSEAAFWSGSALGISLKRLQFDDRLRAQIAFKNHRGLPEIFNSHIAGCSENDQLVFVHDDVWIDDYFLADRVLEGLKVYDVIGVAGNRRRLPGQPAWAFKDTKLTWDEKVFLSGSVGHGTHPFGGVTSFGPVPQDCELLDGVFLAANAANLRKHNIYFDNRFDFHFYDMDFCRTARKGNLRLGTWPICLTHQSRGAFSSPEWRQKHIAYLDKWGE